jgi:outer membrane receptor protein involved in Fe transport
MKSTTRILMWTAFLVAASIVAMRPTSGQVAGGTILGTVTDQTGAAIADAQISIMNSRTNVTRTATTNSDGFYTVPNMLPGDYVVTATAAGFAETVATGITLTVGAQQSVNVSMRVGASTQRVEVTGAAPLVDLTTSTVGGVVGATTVRELPLNGRDWTQLATLQPGVATVNTQPSISNLSSGRGQRGFGVQMTISGGRPQQNNYRLDGISINDYSNGAPGSALGSTFGVEAIQQFSVLTSAYNAEYGKSSGGVINAITRSGTNGFHGEAYEFLRNSALDARNFFDRSSVPPFRRNQFGAAAGAPIRKDRTFVFANYEGLRQSLGVTSVDITPSAAARAGNLSTGTVKVSPLVAPFLGLYPLPNGGLLAGGDAGIFNISTQQVTLEDFFTTRVDHKFSNTDSLAGTYIFDRSSVNQPDEFKNKLVKFHTRQQVVALEETHIFSPEAVNSVRVGLSREPALISDTTTTLNPLATDLTLGFVPGLPAGGLRIPGITNFSGGQGGVSYYNFHYTSIQAYDDFFLTRGLHSIKIGFALERIRNNMLSASNPNGVFSFSSLANFLTDKPRILTASPLGTVTPRGIRQTIVGGYVQDDWRWRPNLTLNLGLRYETASVPTEVNGKISTLRNPTDSYTLNHLGDPFFSNPTRLNFAPRVGFAWDPFKNGKTAVRGGFGIYDNLPLPYLFELLTISAAPFFQSYSSAALPAGSFPTGAFQLINGNPAALRYTYIEPNPHRNYVMQWNLNLQRDLGHNLTATLGYVGSRGVHQPFRTDDMNLVLPTLTAQGYLWPSPAGSGTKLNPNAGLINGLMWGENTFYHALQAQVKKFMGHGFQLQGSFTWSKSIDSGSAAIAGDAFGNSQSSLPWFDLGLDRGLSDFNVGRNLVISYTWNLPSPKSLPRPANWALGGWELGGIYQARDGQPFSVIIGGDPLGEKSSDTTGSADDPNRMPGPGCTSLVNPGNPNNYIKLQCLSFPSPSTLRGNLGRNTLTGPGLSNFDLSLFKNNYVSKVSESFNVQFRWELFNVLNRANFAQPLANNTIFDQSGNLVPGAGLITSTQTPSRQMQFGLKVIW